MRIGIIAPPWVPVPPIAYGGTEVMVDGLARGLADAGHEVVLYTTGDSTCPVERRYKLESSEGMRMGDIMLEFGHAQSAYDLVDDVDIIHDHTIIGPLCSIGVAKVPVVTTNHGPFIPSTVDYWEGISKRGIPIVSISNDQASRAIGEIEIAKVIHHGLKYEDIPVGDGKGAYLACLTRMNPEKGVHQAVMIARDAGVPLQIAAKMREPLEREYFESEVRPLLGGDIEYLGELNYKEKFDLLGGAMGLLNPLQWNEPFGLVMIEAMACGTPVLTFNKGSAPEIVTDGVTGILCNNYDEMIYAVEKLKELDRQTCRWEVETIFSAERMVEDHLDFYYDVIANSNVSSSGVVQNSSTRTTS